MVESYDLQIMINFPAFSNYASIFSYFENWIAYNFQKTLKEWFTYDIVIDLINGNVSSIKMMIIVFMTCFYYYGLKVTSS